MDTKPYAAPAVTMLAMFHLWSTSSQPAAQNAFLSTFDDGSAVCMFALLAHGMYRHSIDTLERWDKAIRTERERPGIRPELQAIARLRRSSG